MILAHADSQIHLVTILCVAAPLAMDAFTVSIVTGSIYKDLHVRHALRMALLFGGFQAVMPVIGYLAGLGLKSHIAACDHWIAFGLLSFVGGKMIYEAFRIESTQKNRDPADHRRCHLWSVLRGDLHHQALRPLFRRPDRNGRWRDPDRNRGQDPGRAPPVTFARMLRHTGRRHCRMPLCWRVTRGFVGTKDKIGCLCRENS